MKQALFLLNMGGPNNLDEVKLFLYNMFSDKNIIPNPLIRPLVRTIIIKKRLNEAKETYAELGGKSPLYDLTMQLIDKLSSKLTMPIYPVMRYVPPFALSALQECKENGIEEILLFPLYPQYSTTTTLSSYEDLIQACEVLDYHPQITFIKERYYDDFDYIKASAEKIKEALEDKESKEYDLILSAHGLPVSIIKAGDPYQREVEANVSALKTYLMTEGIFFNNIKLVYQSKVGPQQWLQPALVDTLRNPRNRKIIIYPLAFTIDNSETLFELDIEAREIAEKIKYEDFIVAKCMNDSDAFVDLIVKSVEEYNADTAK
ncbi:ferrochelatase [Sulfurovum sp. zt1-1]|uniref:Ferrochelatase n=1 Tax=Sulfurovum zhangzhouensis TaxID=3019067 RepID=A0ABT7QW46_9BACT|nr:ferrochelatase [Sulfurovum zhangzhouensis]MDM5271012.1 ferrochelatase [Sulfurovum zhangzhouensis]